MTILIYITLLTNFEIWHCFKIIWTIRTRIVFIVSQYFIAFALTIGGVYPMVIGFIVIIVIIILILLNPIIEFIFFSTFTTIMIRFHNMRNGKLTFFIQVCSIKSIFKYFIVKIGRAHV